VRVPAKAGAFVAVDSGELRRPARPGTAGRPAAQSADGISLGPRLEVGPGPGAGPPRCWFEAGCWNYDPEHRRQFVHSSAEGFEGRHACRYGLTCYQRNKEHLERFAHPGDRSYRAGKVLFEPGQKPEFQTLWQLFQFHDPDESGYLSQQEFFGALPSLAALAPGRVPASASQAWLDVGNPGDGYVNFRAFLGWVQGCLGIDYPIGLEVSGSFQPCRFRFASSSGTSCSCPHFQAVEGGALCVCGHKPSMHRSDFAERTVTQFLETAVNEHWTFEEGLVQVEETEVLMKLQHLLNYTHKPTENWTRDRGCQFHGVNGCPLACCMKNKIPVPASYQLIMAFRNQNVDLWKKYSLVKSYISDECAREGPLLDFRIASSSIEIDTPLDKSCSEWRVFHGSSPKKCVSICASNFRPGLAGTGATWKDPGGVRGTPLYGFGLYFAESITKADEYSSAIEEGEEGAGFFCALVCRVLGGKSNLVTTNEIEVDKLRKEVFDGPFHSVFGDRVSSLGKPFREIVVYDKDQCYPEFLLIYQRNFR